MNFLYPAVLWALMALAIPVVIHLFNFHRYRILPFSNTQFIKAIQAEHRSRSTLRQWLLLLLRLLIVALVVLAFAQPYIPKNEGDSAEKSRVAVYIDNSFSMDAGGEHGTLLESAKTMACQLADAYPATTEYLLITNEMEPQQQRWVGREQFTDWVRRVQTTHLVADIDEVIHRQQIIGRDTAAALHSFLFSDLHRPAFSVRNVQPAARQHLFIVPMTNGTRNNISVDSLWFSSPGLYMGKIEEMTVRLRNHGSEPLTNLNLQVFVNDTMKNTVPFSLEAGGSLDVKCTFLHSRRGWNSGYVAIQDYPITFDNRLYFSFNIQQHTNVLCISDKTDVDYLDALYRTDSSVLYRRVSPFSVKYDKLADNQLIILDSPVQLSSGAVEQLAKFAANGGHLALLTSRDGDFDQLLKATSGPQLKAWVAQSGAAANLNIGHSLFRDAFFDRPKNYSMPTYDGFFDVSATSRQRITRLFDTESGGLLMFEYGFGQGRIYVSAVPLAPSHTNLMFHSVFVPLFFNMAIQSTTSGRLYSTLSADMQLPVDVRDASKNISLVGADGASFFPVKRIGDGGVVLYPDAAVLTAGNYSVMADNEQDGCVSFNFDRSESVQQFFEPDEVLEMFRQRGFDADLLKQGGAFADSVAASQTDFGLWRLFVALALIVLLAETALLRLWRS
ncbi:MAG: BatA domain-containing protein [Salinivirgaceae bacterium]|nr:BatA domain-containing protein [Salinivirgaceae bacterium]